MRDPIDEFDLHLSQNENQKKPLRDAERSSNLANDQEANPKALVSARFTADPEESELIGDRLERDAGAAHAGEPEWEPHDPRRGGKPAEW